MKKLIIITFLFQIATSLSANVTYDQYISMKKEAYNLYENKRSDEAIALVNSFIKEHPNSIRSQNLLAVFYYWNGEYKKSKSILEDIVKKEKFPQAVSLLKRVDRKLGVSKVSKVKTKQSKQAIKQVKKKRTIVKKQKASKNIDLIALVNNIKNNPYDIESRKILSKHYDKIGNSQKAIYFANEVLKINPDDKEMLFYLKSKNVKKSFHADGKTMSKAIKKLETLFEKQEYNRFMNLYTSLEHNNVVMPTQIHVDALYSAISLKDYKKAKSILHIYRMPKNRHIAEIRKLIDEKLMLSRFASLDDCQSSKCSISR